MNAHDDAEARYLDGNAMGGPLAELFTQDLTAATLICANCGGEKPLAAHPVYPDAPAMVVRCPGCTSVVMRYASDQRGVRFEMSGVRLLTITERSEQTA